MSGHTLWTTGNLESLQPHDCFWAGSVGMNAFMSAKVCSQIRSLISEGSARRGGGLLDVEAGMEGKVPLMLARTVLSWPKCRMLRIGILEV